MTGHTYIYIHKVMKHNDKIHYEMENDELNMINQNTVEESRHFIVNALSTRWSVATFLNSRRTIAPPGITDVYPHE